MTKPPYPVWSRAHWPKTQGIKVETFRIDYIIRTPKVEKLSLQAIRESLGLRVYVSGFGTLNPKVLKLG